jgi:hypothetical protein
MGAGTQERWVAMGRAELRRQRGTGRQGALAGDLWGGVMETGGWGGRGERPVSCVLYRFLQTK